MSSPLPPTRIRRSAVRRGAALCAALLCPALLCTAGCGAGFNAASLDVKPDTGSAQLGGLRINNVVVVTDPATGNAEVIAAVANTTGRSDQLVSVTAAGLPATVRRTAPAPLSVALPIGDVTVAGNAVTIGNGAAVSLGQPGRPELEISGGTFTPGHFTRVELTFANAGRAGINAVVMSNTGLYADYDPNGPNPVNTPNLVARPTPSTGAPSAGTASPTPSTSAPSPSGQTASPTSSASTIALAKASTTLAHTTHLHGSREPHR